MRAWEADVSAVQRVSGLAVRPHHLILGAALAGFGFEVGTEIGRSLLLIIVGLLHAAGL